jgi:hypothetical protein
MNSLAGQLTSSFLGTFSGFSGPTASLESLQIHLHTNVETTNFSEARSSNELNPRVLFYLYGMAPSETTTKQTDKALWRQLQ